MTNDEIVALVEKAKGINAEVLSIARTALSQNVDENYIPFYEKVERLCLAHKAFFARHEEFDDGEIKTYCYLCLVPYPCPELVTTADVIVNGVEKRKEYN